MKPTTDEQLVQLHSAIRREAEAAETTARELDALRTSVETRNAYAHRHAVTRAKDAFDELTRSAALRNSLAGRLATTVGLKRDALLSELIEVLGRRGEELQRLAAALMEKLQLLRSAMAVQAILTRYGMAMANSLMEMLSGARGPVPYGRDGQRTTAYTGVGQTA